MSATDDSKMLCVRGAENFLLTHMLIPDAALNPVNPKVRDVFRRVNFLISSRLKNHLGITIWAGENLMELKNTCQCKDISPLCLIENLARQHNPFEVHGG
jgi:hypothetical protein